MKVAAFNSSPRRDGNTAILLRRVLAELEAEGIETELVQLAGKRISGCTACLKCAETKDNRCHGVSDDGITWCLGDVALAPTPRTWDQRGTRVAAVVVEDGSWLAYYDGRDSAEANAEELTGIAIGSAPDHLVAQPGPVASSPDRAGGSLRYLDVVALPDGGMRLFYEATRRDGAHDLRTEYVPPSR